VSDSRVPENSEEVVEKCEKSEFEHLQSYAKIVPATLRCKTCKATQFFVGHNDAYQTIIKCPNCKWEYCVHEG